MKKYWPTRAIILTLLDFGLLVNAQSFKPLDNYPFDSSYRLISIANHQMKTGGHSSYNFIINDPQELNKIGKNWKLKDRHQNISLEDTTVEIYIVKAKELLEIPLLVYPQQKIAHYKGSWYEFDIANITNTAQTHPLNCHSRDFTFDQYSEYIFFEDSIQADAHLLFLVKPSPRKFPGHFNVYLKKENLHSPSMSAMSDVYDYLAKNSSAPSLRSVLRWTMPVRIQGRTK